MGDPATLNDLVDDRPMGEVDGHTDRAGSATPEIDRIVQVLSLEYDTLREEILVRTTVRFQFVGFVTAAAGLIGAGIGLSSYGIKTWVLVGLAVAVIAVGLYGYFRMRYHIIGLSARIALLERRINDLVPAEPGFDSLLSWESDHQGTAVYGRPLSLIHWFRMPAP
jgi:hypothetical protein